MGSASARPDRGSRPPVRGSIRNTTTLLPGMSGAEQEFAAGRDREILRSPSPAGHNLQCSPRPPSLPIRYTAMLSWPRLVAYRKRPSGVTLHVGEAADPVEILRQCGHRLRVRRACRGGVIIELRHGVLKLVDHIHVLRAGDGTSSAGSGALAACGRTVAGGARVARIHGPGDRSGSGRSPGRRPARTGCPG